MKLNPIENWIFRSQSFNPRKLFNMEFLAGLLTFPIIVIPSHFALHETVDLSFLRFPFFFWEVGQAFTAAGLFRIFT